MRTLDVVVLSLLVSACGMPEDGPDAEILGAQIWWGDRVHEDAHAYLAECAAFLERRNFDGMSVIFDGEQSWIWRSCRQEHVAGCTIQVRNAAIVHDQPSIWNTALCHEAVHVFVAPYDVDHELPIWQELGAARLNGSSHPAEAQSPCVLGEARNEPLP